jgi:hypothetical protein
MECDMSPTSNPNGRDVFVSEKPLRDAFMRKLQRVMATHTLPKGWDYTVIVVHEAGCARNRGGDCDCEPDPTVIGRPRTPAAGKGSA